MTFADLRCAAATALTVICLASLACDVEPAQTLDDRELVPATFAAGDWHIAEGRLACLKGVVRTRVGHTSINARQPEPGDTKFIGKLMARLKV